MAVRKSDGPGRRVWGDIPARDSAILGDWTLGSWSERLCITQPFSPLSIPAHAAVVALAFHIPWAGQRNPTFQPFSGFILTVGFPTTSTWGTLSLLQGSFQISPAPWGHTYNPAAPYNDRQLSPLFFLNLHFVFPGDFLLFFLTVKIYLVRTSLLVQWLIMCLTTQGIQVQSLVRELRSHVQLSLWATTTEPACHSERVYVPTPKILHDTGKILGPAVRPDMAK